MIFESFKKSKFLRHLTSVSKIDRVNHTSYDAMIRFLFRFRINLKDWLRNFCVCRYVWPVTGWIWFDLRTCLACETDAWQKVKIFPSDAKWKENKMFVHEKRNIIFYLKYLLVAFLKGKHTVWLNMSQRYEWQCIFSKTIIHF